MGTIAEDLALGLKHHQAGQLQQAEQLYQQVLARDPRHADALHLWGVTALQAGRHAEAVERIERAIALNPGQAAYYNHLGIASAHLGRAEQAEQAFRETVRLSPNLADAHYNLGNVLRDAGNLPGAIASFRQAVALRPRYAEAWFNLGNALRAAGEHQEAAASFRTALAARPGYYKSQLNLGDTLHDLGQWDQAAAEFHQVLAAQPDNAKAHNNLGTVLRSQGRHEEARDRFEQAIALDPEFAEAHANLGSALLDLKQTEAARQSFERALAINPQYAKAYNGLGAAHRAQDDIDAAMACFRRATELSPELSEAHTNLGCALQELGRYGEAEASFERALQAKPDCAESHFARSSVWLLQGDMQRGWPEYEWRLKAKDRPPHKLRQPLWDGSPLDGRSILLLAEQGMGDTLQFIRYARQIKELGGVVTVGCPPPLIRLLSSCPYVERLASELSPEGFDFQAPLLSLPRIFHTTLETIPAEVPYLFADEELIAKWREVLGRIEGFKVGINWQGNPKYPGDRQRSMPLAHFQPLAEVPGVRLVSLQHGLGTEQIPQVADRFEVVQLEGDIDRSAGAFMDTAAIMKGLDLVVSSDTSTVHLAGALGVPIWMATPFSPDWRWLLEREDSPWYPTMRLFRQPRPGDWESVFARMAKPLAELVQRQVGAD